MNRGTWRTTVRGVEKSWRSLSNWAYSTLINPSFQYFIHRSIVVWVHKQNLLKIPGFGSTLPGHLVAIIYHICAVIHHFMGNRRGKGGNSENLFSSSKIIVDDDCSHEIRRQLLLSKKVMTNLDSVLKSRDITLLVKVHIVKAIVFPVVMFRCESWTIKEGRVLKNWCFQIMVLEKSLESHLESKETKPMYLKRNQPWILCGKTDADAEAEAPILGPLDVKSWLIRKNPDSWKDWRQKEKRTAEDEMVGCNHWFNGNELEQTPRDGEGQGSLAWCSPRDQSQIRLGDWTTTKT